LKHLEGSNSNSQNAPGRVVRGSGTRDLEALNQTPGERLAVYNWSGSTTCWACGRGDPRSRSPWNLVRLIQTTQTGIVLAEGTVALVRETLT
jgi:hypothetical protein